MDPPPGTINHKMVLNYVGSPVLFFELEKGIHYTEQLREQIRKYKIVYLEQHLGYKLEKLDNIIPHDEYEQQLFSAVK